MLSISIARPALILIAIMVMLATDRAGAGSNPLAAPAPSAPFAGSFAGDQLSVVLNPSSDGAYTGELKMAGKTYAAKAHATTDGIAGSFNVDGQDFPFTASLDNQTLTLVSANTAYKMTRQGSPPMKANPLEGAAPAPAPDNAPAGQTPADPLPTPALPDGFSELGATPTGRSVFVSYSDVKTVDELIQKIGDALGTIFDGKPKFDNASVDSKDRNKGVAAFSATLKGNAIKGLVMFGVDPQARSSASVIYSRPNASKDEMDTLMASLPTQPKLQPVQMSDGSGSISVPPGWTPRMQSLTAGPIMVSGPQKQVLLWGMKIGVDTPNSFRVQTAIRNHDSAVRVWELGGRRGPQPKPVEEYLKFYIISPPLDPEEAFNKILPLVNDRGRRQGKPWTEYGPILSKMKADPAISGGQAEMFSVESKLHVGEQVTESSHQIIQLETDQLDASTWNLRMGAFIAPVSTFSRELPVMLQILSSVKIADGAVGRQIEKDNKAFQQMCAYYAAKNEAMLERGREFQENMKEQVERHMQQIAAQEKAVHDSSSDTIEMSLGVRDVYDRATGQMVQVDLYNSTAITDTLNNLANDPNRFVQVPLRYLR